MANTIKYKGQLYKRVDAATEKLEKTISDFEKQCKEAQKEIGLLLRDASGYKLAIGKGNFKEAFEIAKQIEAQKLYGVDNVINARKTLPASTRKFGGLGTSE